MLRKLFTVDQVLMVTSTFLAQSDEVGLKRLCSSPTRFEFLDLGKWTMSQFVQHLIL